MAHRLPSVTRLTQAVAPGRRVAAFLLELTRERGLVASGELHSAFQRVTRIDDDASSKTEFAAMLDSLRNAEMITLSPTIQPCFVDSLGLVALTPKGAGFLDQITPRDHATV